MPPSTLHKPWSLSRRLVYTAIFSSIILGTSLFLGSSLYRLGENIGFFSPQNLYHLITEEVMSHPELVRDFYQSLQTSLCRNDFYHFTLSYPPSFTPTVSSSPELNCTEFTRLQSGSTTVEYLKLTIDFKPASQVLSQALLPFNQVNTDSFSHPQYPATIIWGQQGSVPVSIVLLDPPGDRTYSLYSYPFSSQNQAEFNRIAQSFTLATL